MRLPTNIRTVLVSDRGSASAAVVFVIVAAVLGGILATIALSVTSATSATTGITMMESAITARANAYITELTSTSTPETGEVCYPGTRSCVAVVETGPQEIELTAVYNGGDQTITRTRTVSSGVTHIAGYNDHGEPIWVDEPGYTQFPAR